MNINELRIDNYVIYLNYIIHMERQYFCDNIACRILQPVPLTEQWLLDLQSRSHKSEKCKNTDSIIIDRFALIYMAKYGFWYVYDRDSMVYITKVSSVHEWQNVFYILNGEELTKK